MLMDFVAVILIGACAAGAVFIYNHLGGKLGAPRAASWVMPAAIGAALIASSIWNEYSWFGRAQAQLPATVVVASAPEEKVFYRPWTYVFPLVTRFIAVDRAPGEKAEVFATLAFVVNRWGSTQSVPVAFDCAGGRRADLIGGVSLNEDGTLDGGEWSAVGAQDSLVRAACMGG